VPGALVRPSRVPGARNGENTGCDVRRASHDERDNVVVSESANHGRKEAIEATGRQMARL
jgi:hypothetical protein